jgi:hypothetical protein
LKTFIPDEGLAIPAPTMPGTVVIPATRLVEVVFLLAILPGSLVAQELVLLAGRV